MLLNPYRFGGGVAPASGYPKLLDINSASFNTPSTTHAIPLGTYAVGDLVVIFVATRSDSTTSPTLPSGWLGFLNAANTTPSPDGRRGYMYRVMDGTEGSSVTLTYPDSRVLTYNRLRFEAGSFSSDLGYLLQFSGTNGTGSSIDPANSTPIMYYPAATAVRSVSLFGLAGVSTYPFPSGAQSSAAGTGISGTSAKSFANVGEDVTVGSVYDWSAWALDASNDFYEVSYLVRGSKALGHVDPRYLSGNALVSAGTTASAALDSNLKVGDMLIVISQAEFGTLTSITTGGGSLATVHRNSGFDVLYRVITAGDIGSNISFTYSTSGNHAWQLIRVRAGTFESGAVPQVGSNNSGISSAPATPSTGGLSGYAGKRNLMLFAEGQVYTSSQSILTASGLTLGPFSSNGGSSDAASCGCSFQYFDGQPIPAASGTLSASASWKAVTVVLKGLAIP